ncbi:hypothetical protein [Methylomonas sp. HYX-M1]|uniref:hypothetical protein n=1 Tax=Methylomonas sp. HYX-M1 TaxID=3139307 RepID=UPI00345BEE2B
MSLTSQLPHLNATQLRSLSSTLLNASLAHENGGNPREIFRRAKYRHIGLMQRIYELLQHASHAEIDQLSKHIAEINP